MPKNSLLFVAGGITYNKEDNQKLQKIYSRKIIETESRREWMLVIFGKTGKSIPNNRNFEVWRQDNHPIELFTDSVINQKKNTYI